MQKLLPQPQQHPVLDKSSSKSTRAAKPPVSFQHQPVPACNPLEKITPPPHSDHQQSPLPSQEPCRALTLFLQHLVGLQDLHLVRQPQRPAVHQLQDLGLHFLRRPAAEILEESRGGLKLIRAATSLTRSPPPLPQEKRARQLPMAQGQRGSRQERSRGPCNTSLSASTAGGGRNWRWC